MNRPARPVAMHDTTEYRRAVRAERLAFYVVLAVAAVTLYTLASNAGLVFA